MIHEELIGKDDSTTLAELATRNPASIAVFNRFGLDYCCGGHNSLLSACEQAGVDVGEVQSAIDSTDIESEEKIGPVYSEMGMGALADHILDKHHTFLRENLPELSRLSEKIAQVHGEGAPYLLDLNQTMKGLANELTHHMQKEEMILFPYIMELSTRIERGENAPTPGFGTVQNPVQMMMLEHDGAGDALKKMRFLTNDYQLPEGACMTWWQTYQMMQELEKDLMLHIHLENNILFPAAIAAEQSK